MQATTRQRLGRDGMGARAYSISANRTSKTQLRVIRIEADQLYPVDAQRPRTRGECESLGQNQDRPCPFVSCRHHLALDVHPTRGALKLNRPGLEEGDLDGMAETCSLDVADRPGGSTLEEVGLLLNLTRERVRQIGEEGVERLVRSGGAEKLVEFAAHIGDRPESGLAQAQEDARGKGGGAQSVEERSQARRWKPLEPPTKTYAEALASPLIEESDMKFKDKTCPQCKYEFEPTGARQKFCSDKCKAKAGKKPAKKAGGRKARKPRQSRQSAQPVEHPSPEPAKVRLLVSPREVLEMAGFEDIEEIVTPRGIMLMIPDSDPPDPEEE